MNKHWKVNIPSERLETLRFGNHFCLGHPSLGPFAVNVGVQVPTQWVIPYE